MRLMKVVLLFGVLLSSVSLAEVFAGIDRKHSEGTKTVDGVCLEWMKIVSVSEGEPYNERYWTRPCGSTGAWLLEYDGCPRGSITGSPITIDGQGNGTVTVSSGDGGAFYAQSTPVGSISFVPDGSSTLYIEAAVMVYQNTCN